MCPNLLPPATIAHCFGTSLESDKFRTQFPVGDTISGPCAELCYRHSMEQNGERGSRT